MSAACPRRGTAAPGRNQDMALQQTEAVASCPVSSNSEDSGTESPESDCNACSVEAPPGDAEASQSGGGSLCWGGPRLSIAVLVAGTFGDMQPFVVLSKELQRQGHRIRLATHGNYWQFVEEQGIEFFPLGGDPEFLSKLMVKNHGFLPAGVGELTRQRQEFQDILFSTWGACTQPTPASALPFLADCIIANPPAAGHIHCAEKLGVPLHIVFTMPWSPTWAYPHPLSYTRYKRGARTLRNRLSYFATETFIYSGVSDIVQKFRVEQLGLEKAPTLGGAAMTLQNLKVPFTYAWSPSLAPKPRDWGPHIDVVGFLFLEEPQEQQYRPPPALAAFLAAGPPPVYIGFGSMVCQDPIKLTDTIFRAVDKAGIRAVMNRGWGKFGSSTPPPSICLIDHTPHSWLFPRCSGVVHHGGAGTTAAGALVGRPTLIVPFFGDQSMWGELIAKFGCGPPPIPVDHLSEAKLVAAFRLLHTPAVQAAAARLAARLAAEDGARAAAAAFHRHLPRAAMLCDLSPTRLARFVCDDCGGLKLSAYADRVLHEGPLAATHAAHRRRHYRPLNWHAQHELAYQGLGGALAVFWGELAGTVAGPVKLPVQGYCSGGPRGAVRGLGRGLAGLLTRPLRATARLGERAGRALDRALAVRREEDTTARWRYGEAGGCPQQRTESVAAIEDPVQGVRAAGLALGRGLVAGFAALGAWPTAGYRRWGVAGGAGCAAVGGAALLAKLGAAVLLSAACLVACIPAGAEAAGRQLSCWRGQVVDEAGAESIGAQRDATVLAMLEAIERQEANEAPLEGSAAQAVLDKYATWQAQHVEPATPPTGCRTDRGEKGASGTRCGRWRWGGRGKVAETEKEDGSAQRQVPIGTESDNKDVAAGSVQGRPSHNKRWWAAARRRLLCSHFRVRE